GDRLQRQLRRDLALGVAAHAIGQDEQARFPRVAIAHAVFVLLAAAAAADLEHGEFHGRLRAVRRVPYFALAPNFVARTMVFLVSDTMLSNCRRIFSPTDSLV